MISLKRTFELFCFVTCCSACVKEQTAFTDTPVIAAYMTPGDSLKIKITRQIPFATDVSYSSDDINNLSIELSCNDEMFAMEALGNGIYRASQKLVPASGNLNLSFNFNQKLVKAYSSLPSAPSNFSASVSEISITKLDTTSGPPIGGLESIATLTLSWINSDNSNYLVLVENMETSPEAIRDFGSKAPPAFRFKKQPTTSNTEAVRGQEFQYFGKHRIVLYHVLPDYATLYDQTSTSSQNLTNPSTSISNGYGIFTGLNTDTLYITVKKK
jgi:hypothetical protein